MSIEIRLNDDGTLDEIVGKNVTFHLEEMDDTHWWMGITDKKGTVHVHLVTKRASIKASYNDERVD